MIKIELSRRGIEVRPFLHRDWMIPASVALVAVSIGLGVTTGIEGIVPIGSPGQHGVIALTDHGSGDAARHAVEAGANPGGDSSLSDPSHLLSLPGSEHMVQPVQDAAGSTGHQSIIEEWAAGFRDQIQSLFNTHHAIVGVTPDGTYRSAVAWVTGANSAQTMEKQLMALLGQQTVSMMCERLDSESLRPRRLKGVTCSRVPWAVDNFCSICDTPISSGKFYHFCGSNGEQEEVSFCNRCFAKGEIGDMALPHLPLLVQTALPGRFFLPEEGIKKIGTIAGPSALGCNGCGDKITRGWYYDCWECRRIARPWTLCMKCYQSGRTCVGDASHSFYAFQRTVYAPIETRSPYETSRATPSGQVSCSVCHDLLAKGAYYHCSKCDGGRFDLCGRCFAEDEHCKKSEHTLVKYYAWKRQRWFDKRGKAEWSCSNSQCQFQDRPRGAFYFSCREEDCDKGSYNVCAPCYGLDFLCPNKGHDMYKCVWSS
jgi:hypothetical protein